MKIGLLTYYWTDNPGQFFQALATQQALQRKFPSAHVEIVNFRHWNTPWRPSMRWKKFVPSILKHQAYEKARRRFNLSPGLLVSKDRREVLEYVARQGYDALVVGSDVVLKLLPKVTGEQLPAYWLGRELTMKKFMLASSADTTRAEDLTEAQRKAMRECLDGFSLLAVRDRMTWNLLTDLGVDENDPRLMRVSDPTFTYPVSSLQTHRPHALNKDDGKPVCGIHLPRNKFTEELVSLLKVRYRIVAIGGMPWPGLPWWGGGPDEWVNLFSHLDLVITVSFHESIFAVKHAVPVLAVDAEEYRIDLKSGLSKTFCLMQEIGLEERHISPHNGMSAKSAYDRALGSTDSFSNRSMRDTIEHCAQTYSAALDRISVMVSR